MEIKRADAAATIESQEHHRQQERRADNDCRRPLRTGRPSEEDLQGVRAVVQHAAALDAQLPLCLTLACYYQLRNAAHSLAEEPAVHKQRSIAAANLPLIDAGGSCNDDERS